jgi:N-acetylneuraminic acid mutarotase
VSIAGQPSVRDKAAGTVRSRTAGVRLVVPALMILSGLIVLSSCGPAETPEYPVTINVSPDSARVLVGQTAQFTANVFGAMNKSVIWSLSGSGCSGAACGTVDSDGLYTAPAGLAASPLAVTVRATSKADTSKSAGATVTVFQPGAAEWTWISGSDLRFQPGRYGALREPGPDNAPGGRESSASWLDPQGNLWVFGGYTRDSEWGYQNDLWKYEPATGLWTWMSGSPDRDQAGMYGTKGVPGPANVPGAREGAYAGSGTDGILWLFGGFGFDAAGRWGLLNDLWAFDTQSLEWTWVAGSDGRDMPGVYGTKGVASASNSPGARNTGEAWFDHQGRFWIFGGIAWDSEAHQFLINDLWMFDTSTHLWTWVSGSNIIAQPGSYGTRNVASPSNVPGARRFSAGAVDASGDLWMFGGDGYGAVNGNDWLNDLWKFDPGTRQWTWLSGSDALDQAGRYGTKGLPDPSNVPGAREQPALWIDAAGKLWLFGGDGNDAVNHQALQNDLWQFDPVSLEWAWVGGSDQLGQLGVYGTKGVADPLNIPGARYAGEYKADAQGRFWLFGGVAADSAGQGGHMNDLWHFVIVR